MIRPTVRSEMFRWARRRARLPQERLLRRFPRLPAWEDGSVSPTLKQLEAYANATHAPVGYFFLPQPPKEALPVQDLRSGRRPGALGPSPELLDTIYICQQRQEWYRDLATLDGDGPLGFAGSTSLRTPPPAAAHAIREAIGFDLDARREAPTWREALRLLIEQVDASGVLVMRSGIVGNNTHRKLDVNEFRGFALSDPIAPVVFINSADSQSAQMFTLAHELGHIWLGQSAVDNPDMRSAPDDATEKWCNQVAAELLVPMDVFRPSISDVRDPTAHLKQLARQYKVSTLMILRRLLDAGAISARVFRSAFDEELARIPERKPSGGGDFYRTEATRVGRRFATAVIGSTLEGRTSFTDAHRMLGITKAETFTEFGRQLGVIT